MSAEPIDEKAVFNLARRIDGRQARADYLQQVCGAHPEALQRVLELLQVHEQEQSFLESPAVAMNDTLDQPITEKPGAQIGPYKLLQQIGEGGMGVVYMAEQSAPVKRRVALKIIKPGMDTRQVIARFEAERQALSLMDHPNIAKVLDAGTTDSGRPYFVMELVKGQPITQYCDEHHLSPRQRLELLLPVCQAIQHAHHKGIIHRDIKPTNILVAEYDQQPVPKVIDFGVAKATSQTLTEKTMFTGYGQIVGTLEYMSPEQAKVNQLDVDTRSDIYSLGVLLYELLTGETPFDRQRLRSAAFDELMRIIREEEPPRPSLRLSSSQSLPSIAANRQIEPTKLSTLVRGELDWIVMKAMEKDRGRRYETANGLANDIRRYLDDEPVVACPPSAGYLFRKFARRNKAAITSVAAILLALIIGVIATTSQAIRATSAERRLQVLLVTEKESRQHADRARQNETSLRELANRQRDRAIAAERVALQESKLAHLREQIVNRNLYAADMNLAYRAFRDGLKDQGMRLLDHYHPTAGQEDLRMFEWHHLFREWAGDQRQRFAGAQCIALHPYKPLIAVGTSENSQIRICDMLSGEQRFTLQAPDNGVVSLAFSPDGDILASGGGDGRGGAASGSVQLWDFPSGRARETWRGHSLSVQRLSFSKDGRLLASASGSGYNDKTARGEVILWDVPAGSLRHRLDAHTQGVCGVSFSGDGSILATCGWDSRLCLWNPDTGVSIESPPISAMTGLAFSPDRSILIVAHENLAPQVWDFSKKTVVDAELPGAYSVSFAPDGKYFALGAGNGLISIYRSESLTLERVLQGPGYIVDHLEFSRDGRYLAAAGLRGGARVWDLHDRPEDFVARAHTEGKLLAPWPSRRHVVSLSPEGECLAVAIQPATVALYDLPSRQMRLQLQHDSGTVVAIAFSPDGQTVATACKPNGHVRLWDRNTGHELRRFMETADFCALSFSPNGEMLAAAGAEGNGKTKHGFGCLRVWDPRTGQLKQSPILTCGPVSDICFAPDSSKLALATTLAIHETGREPGTVLVWDVNGNQIAAIGAFSQHVLSVAFSPDGKMIAAGDGDWFSQNNAGATSVWDLATGRKLAQLDGHRSFVTGTAFSPEGDTLVTSSATSVRLWDTRNWRQRVAFEWDEDWVEQVFFSPGMDTLYALGRKGQLKTWKAAPCASKLETRDQ